MLQSKRWRFDPVVVIIFRSFFRAPASERRGGGGAGRGRCDGRIKRPEPSRVSLRFLARVALETAPGDPQPLADVDVPAVFLERSF